MRATVGDDLRLLADQGVAVVVGTRDAAGVPEVSRGWGVRVLPQQQVLEVCLPAGSNRQALDNLEDNQQIAVTLALPSTYRSVQLKGRAVDISTPSPDELQRVARHREAFLREAAAAGLPEHLGSRLFAVEDAASAGLVRVRVAVDEVFDQTPGPTAGSRL